MIKFRHLAGNELGHEVPPPRRRTGARAAATRSSPAPPPAAPASSQHTAGASAAAGTRTRSTASHAQPVLTEAQQQAQLAAAQMAAQARLQLANAAIKQAQQGYVQALAAACVWQGAAGAAMETAAAAAAAGAEDAPAQMVAAQQLAQQAAAVQGLLQAARSVYQGAAEEAQAAQLAANAAVAAMLQAAESAADSAVLGLRPGSAQGPADSGTGVPLRSSNRRKAALNRKRFTGERAAGSLGACTAPLDSTRPRFAAVRLSPVLPSALASPCLHILPATLTKPLTPAVTPYAALHSPAEDEVVAEEEAPHARPPSAQGQSLGGDDLVPMDLDEGGGSAGGYGKRRKVGAQKRLHEDTRFGERGMEVTCDWGVAEEGWLLCLKC